MWTNNCTNFNWIWSRVMQKWPKGDWFDMEWPLSIITSAFKHQWSLVFRVEVHELPTIYCNQEEADTRMVLYLIFTHPNIG